MRIVKKLLPSGLRLLLSPMHETKAVTLLILFKVGSRYESKALNGISHFVEHLMFKGTKKRPDTRTIARELDGVGASYNAFTAKDHTGYWIKLAADKLPLAVDILSDMLKHSLFAPKEIERERNVVIEEINMYEDNPMMSIEDLFEETLYGAAHPLGQLIAGPRENIRSFSRSDILGFTHHYYRPRNMLVAVAGNYDERQLLLLLRKHFAHLPPNIRLKPFTPFRVTQRRAVVAVKYKETEQIAFALGFPGLPLRHPDLPALSLLAVILGGSMSSRLFIAIRERRSLCYFIRAGADAYEDTGSFTVQAGLDKRRIEEATKAIWAELCTIRDRGANAGELKRAKEFLRGKLLLELEDSDHIAGWVGKQELLTGTVETPEEKIAKFARVTLVDLQRVARAVVRKDRFALAVIGPYRDQAHFQSLVHTLPQ